MNGEQTAVRLRHSKQSVYVCACVCVLSRRRLTERGICDAMGMKAMRMNTHGSGQTQQQQHQPRRSRAE